MTTDDGQPEHCPACGSPQTESIDALSTRELARLYRSSAQLAVSRFFTGVAVISLNRCQACDLRFYSPPCAGDEAFYEALQQFPWYYHEEKAEFGFAKGHVPADCRLLEVGCGSGAFRGWLPESVDYTGLEFNDEAVRKAASRGVNVSKQSIQDFAAIHAGQYDVVSAFQVLEHIPEPASFIAACIQALKPQGTLIFSVPAEDGFVGMAANIYLNMPPHHALRWSDQALLNLAQREGLTVVDVWHEPVAPYHRELFANVMARRYLANLGLRNVQAVEIGMVDKALAKMFRFKPLRNACAARGAASIAHPEWGHTVALVASKGAAC